MFKIIFFAKAQRTTHRFKFIFKIMQFYRLFLYLFWPRWTFYFILFPYQLYFLVFFWRFLFFRTWTFFWCFSFLARHYRFSANYFWLNFYSFQAGFWRNVPLVTLEAVRERDIVTTAYKLRSGVVK